jgi:hypothetical protein
MNIALLDNGSRMRPKPQGRKPVIARKKRARRLCNYIALVALAA